jgi:four helix bundle protein
MSRDHRKLRAFALADALVIEIYRATRNFPRDELFGLTSQMRRAAVSIAANIVEGCARKNEGEYLHFLNMAFGSLREVGYYIDLTQRLGMLPSEEGGPLSE